MIGGFGRYLALIALLSVVAAASALSVASLHRPADPAATKLSTASRVIAYQVFPDRGPTFQVQGTRLKLVSNAVVDKYDPQRVTSYGFRLSARAGGRVVWRDDVYTQSRESKAGWDGVRWKDEAAWGLDPIALTDERILILDLPNHVANATLSVTLLGAPHEALVRLFRDDVRSATERETAYRRLDANERNELIRSSTYVPWQLLSSQEQDARLEHRWLRIAALGDSGFDVTTRTIYVSDFRVTGTAATSDGIEVARGRDAAINVQGPAQLALAAVTGNLGDLEVAVLSAAGERRVAPDPWGRFDVGAEPATLRVRTDRVEPMRFKVFGPREAQIAVDDVRPPPGELGPDRIRVPFVMVGPNAPVSVPIRTVARMPLLGTAVRIDARVVVHDPPSAAEIALSPVFVAYRTADGSTVRTDRAFVGGAVSTFEQLAVDGGFARVSEPTSLRVIAPPGAVRVELTADRDVALRIYRWSPGAEMIEPAYRGIAVPEFHWRYARLVERNWYPMHVSASASADAMIRSAALDAQVRLEPLVPAETALGALQYQALAPEGHPEQQRAREPVPDDELAAVLTTWPAGSVTRLTPGVARAIHFKDTLTSRPRLSWAADPSAVGSEMRLTVDETRVAVPLTASVGAVDLPRIAAGVHRVVVDGAVRDVWIDRPPSGGGNGVARDRRLYRLTDRLRVRVPRSLGPVHVYAIVYAASAAASTTPSLVMTIDDGRVERRFGVSDKLTNPELRTAIPAARRSQPAVLVDLNGQLAGLPRSIGIGILSDLAEDAHSVELRRIGGGDLWVRFVTTRPAPKLPRQIRAWTSEVGAAMEAGHD